MRGKNVPYPAAMKPIKSLPTSHPNWIDEPEYFEQLRKSRRFGISFPVAFLLVLGLHVVVIAGIYAYSGNKSAKARAKLPAVESAETPPGPKSDAFLVRNDWPQPEAEPEVVATPAPTPKAIAKSTPAPVNKEMPKVAVKEVVKPAEKPAPKPVAVAQKEVRGDEELKRKFLEAAGKLNAVRETVVRSAEPVVAKAVESVRVATEPPVSLPKAAEDREIPVQRAVAVQPPPAPRAIPVATPVQRTGPPPSHYTLAPGDNLYMISRRLGVSYNDLVRANGISDPRQLRVGQTLKVPGVASL